jgi:hypothetical protein
LDALLDLIEWRRSKRSNLQKQVGALKSGRIHVGENRGTGWVDTTGASIERITASMSELDQILAAYERCCRSDRWAGSSAEAWLARQSAPTVENHQCYQALDREG